MLNLALGTPLETEGRSYIKTQAGKMGHAIYGPYEFREPGSYSVDFHLELTERPGRSQDPVCAILDVVRNAGNDVLASRSIKLSDLREGRTRFSLNFVLNDRAKLEYRVWTSGAVALNIDAHRRVQQLNQAANGRMVHELADFPDRDAECPAFFRSRYDRFHEYYDRGFGISFLNEAVVLTFGGINIYVRQDDDFNFIGEVLTEKIYNFVTKDPVCAIDVGMNVGFSTLQFALKENVQEVVSFEPFPETYGRAVDNLSLNPSLASKVKHFCVGLSDQEWSGDVLNTSSDSGSFSVVANTGGNVAVTLKDAASVLGPILRHARERGMRNVLKIDCEGSEYAIFRSLDRAGLFSYVDAVMVEWHAMFDDVNQIDLFEPMHRAGFMIFDRSPPAGNGFFYGVRLGERSPAAA